MADNRRSYQKVWVRSKRARLKMHSQEEPVGPTEEPPLLEQPLIQVSFLWGEGPEGMGG